LTNCIMIVSECY